MRCRRTFGNECAGCGFSLSRNGAVVVGRGIRAQRAFLETVEVAKGQAVISVIHGDSTTASDSEGGESPFILSDIFRVGRRI